MGTEEKFTFNPSYVPVLQYEEFIKKYREQGLITKGDADLIRGCVKEKLVTKNISTGYANMLASLLCRWRQYIKVPYSELTYEAITTGWADLKGNGTYTHHSFVNRDRKVYAPRKYSDGGLNNYLRAMKTFVNWLWENKLIAMSGDDALRTRMIKPFPVRLIQYTPDQILTDEKIGAMIDAAWTLRDKVWIVLMFGCGARPKEMASLRWRDLGFESENEEDYATLYTAVHEGKIMKDGSDVKDSWLYEGLDYVFRLREEQMTKYHDTPDSYVFRCFNRSERRLTDKPMTRSAIDCALRNIGKRAGINFKKGSLQRAFRVGGITNDYRKGMDIVAIAQKHFAAGENTRVLIHYLRATKDDKKKAQIPARLRKKKKTETTAPAEGITCIRCGTKHMAGVTFCDKCHRPLTPSTMTEKADLRRQFEAFEAFKREQMANEAARKGIGEKILKS